MKKTAYIISLIIITALVGCGNAAASDSSGAEAVSIESLPTAENSTETDTEPTQSMTDNGAADENSAAADAAKAATEPTQSTTGSTDAVNESSTTGTPDAASAADTASETKGSAAAKEAGSNKEAALPEYTVTPLEESKAMYATTSVNVRKGPSTDFEIIGSLKFGQEVTVTGQADTQWYEIQYSEDKAFVSNKYLQDEKPVDEPAAADADANADTQQNPEAQTPQPETEAPQPVTEVKNVAGVILVGDSRFVQMQNSVGENSCTWIAESGKGYNWFNEKAIARIDNCVGNGSKILINLGVNDVGNLQKYISLVNAKADEWVEKGAAVYYASVNPVWENPYVTEEQVEYFNSQLRGSLSGNVHWIDSHSYLNSIGYRLVDGLHYSSETYQNLYAYYMSCM